MDIDGRLNELIYNLDVKDGCFDLKGYNQLLFKIEQFIKKYKDEFNLNRIACKEGCGYCCRVNVWCLKIEAKNIADYLLETCELDLFELKEKLKKHMIDIKSMDDEERIAARISCIFLSKENRCNIYPVRPLLCRSVTSVNVDDCIESLTGVYFGENKLILSNLHVKKIYTYLFERLKDLKLDECSECGELTKMVYEVLD